MTLMPANPFIEPGDTLEPLTDTAPVVVADADNPFYLVALREDGFHPISGYRFACGHAAQAQADTMSRVLGTKVQPRRQGPKPPQKVVERTPDPVPEPVAFDENNPEHVALARLYEILSYRRPRGGMGEAAMIAKFIDCVPGMQSDAIGNRYVCIGDPDPDVMWSCHTDSVHREDGMQQITIENGFLKLAKGSGSSCLGADDGAGIWIMLEMIAHAVPGLYVFHYGEESGCIGSRHIVDTTPELVAGIRYAIAFDRADYTDVITHQITGRCCSDAFARSLAAQLPGKYAPDDTGVYTDTAHYIGLIPECTNISVGYKNQHSASEVVNVYHLMALREAMLAIDPSLFVCQRKPQDPDEFGGLYGGGSRYRGYGSYGGYGTTTTSGSRGPISPAAYGGMGLLGEYDDEEDRWHQGLHSFSEAVGRDDDRRMGGRRYEPRSLVDLLENYPTEAADILEQWGFSKESLWDEITSQYRD